MRSGAPRLARGARASEARRFERVLYSVIRSAGGESSVPLYEYKCLKCGRHTDKIEKVSGPHLKKCGHCGGKVEAVITAPSIKFKGSGWYVTDYAGKDSAGGTKADTGSSEPKEGATKESGTKDAGSKDSGAADTDSKSSKDSGSKSSSKESGAKDSKDSRDAKEKKPAKKT